MKKILIIGATSAIARATAQRYAAKGARFCLLARDLDALAELADDLELRGAGEVHYDSFNAEDLEALPALLHDAVETLGGFDIALLAQGWRDTQGPPQVDLDTLVHAFDVNTLSTMVMLGELASHCERQRYGTLAVLSSVAADRGHRSNYVYGATKAALDVFLQGLRHRLHPAGVKVITLKLGLINTPMMAGAPQGVLWRDPAEAAQGIQRALEHKTDVAYIPAWWGPLMCVVRHTPEAIFKRLT